MSVSICIFSANYMYRIEDRAFWAGNMSIFPKLIVAFFKKPCYPVYWKPNPLKGIPFEKITRRF